MPPELLPIDRKDFLKERKPSSSEPVEIVPARWRESPTTPSSHPNNHGSLSCRWGGGGPSDFRRPFTGPRLTPNGNSNPQSDFVNSWDQLQSNNQHKNNNGSSLDWKPLKWVRSGSLSSRGSGFSHSSSCKIIGVDSFDTRTESPQLGNNNLVQSPAGDTAPCVTPRTPDEANSRKKARLGWGEGLAKYEKKKVDPNDIVDKEGGPTCSSSEPSLASPFNLPNKSPNLECASPTTSSSFACSSSPGIEEKTCPTAATVDIDACNPNPNDISQNHTQGLTFSLENLEDTENFSMNSLLDQLLQSDETGSGFAMEKLQVWKADITRTLEITETDIDSLENELKSLIPPASSNKDLKIIPVEMEKPVEDSGTNSVATEKTDSEDKLYDAILASNKVIAKQARYEISSKLLPTTETMRANIITVNDESFVKERIYTRKRFLKFKERVTTLKFRAFHYSWKKDLHMLSVRKNGAKPQKKFESSSHMGYADHHKNRVPVHTRSSSPALVPTKEVVEYVKKLLSDSRATTCRNVEKMPTFILDKSARTVSRFVSDNGLVENPVDVEKEKSIVNFWTEEDKKIFLEKYGLFGKNFKKISSFLPNKTVADCVEFYYKNHKSDLFQKMKKKPEFSKGKSYTANTYLLTSGKQRLNRERETRATTSLDMLGAASAIVSSDQSNDFAMFCNDQETAAADVLAGICGSISPEEALGSCVTSLADNNDVHYRFRRCQKLGGSSLNDVINEETCSDESCGEEMNSSHWTDEEKLSFVKAVRTYGKDFSMISRCVRTRTSDQCKVYFSKARGILGLDLVDVENGSEGTTGANQGGDRDHDDMCMVDSGSGISNENPSMVDLHTSDCREPVEILVLENLAENKPLEGAVDSETADVAESPKNTCSDSVSGAKVEEIKVSDYSDHVKNLDLNAVSENVETVNGFVVSNLFPKKDVERKTVGQDDVSSRLSFRKSGQRSSSIDLHISRRSLNYNNFKLDEKLLMPRDGCLQMSTDMLTPVPIHEQRRSSSVDVEKPSRSGDVKLFGQILTKADEKPDAGIGKSINLKFDNKSNLQLNRSYGFWDGNRIQTGFSSLPDSAVLLAKYPAAFSSVESGGKEQCNMNNNNVVVSGFQARKPNYRGAYAQAFTVDKLLPEVTRRKELEGCNGVSDPVAAIRMHYATAKTEHYKNIGSR